MRNNKIQRSQHPPLAAGLTLVELLVTLAIAAVVASYAIPGLQVIVANNRQTSTINRFVMSVLLARSVAITHRVEAIVCPSFDGLTCHHENDWSLGWIVVKQTGESPGSTDPADYQLVHVERDTSNVSLNVNRSRFHFRPPNKRATNGTAVFCIPYASHPKAVIVSYNGRPRTSRWRANGLALECSD